MTDFRRGSEWRKWDLHLHPPGTRLSDGYGSADWDRYCTALEKSDVHAFGITDYFCLDTDVIRSSVRFRQAALANSP